MVIRGFSAFAIKPNIGEGILVISSPVSFTSIKPISPSAGFLNNDSHKFELTSLIAPNATFGT